VNVGDLVEYNFDTGTSPKGREIGVVVEVEKPPSHGKVHIVVLFPSSPEPVKLYPVHVRRLP